MIKRYLLIMLLPAAVLVAQPGPGSGFRCIAMDEDLQLTKELRVQITEIRSAKQKQTIDLQADLDKLRLELREQMRADRPNRKEIDATLAEMNAKRTAIQQLHVDQHFQVRAILTPEQRDIFGSRPFGGRQFDRGMGKRNPGRRSGDMRYRW